MKKVIEIAGDLFERAQRMARQVNTTFGSLVERGLRLMLREQRGKASKLPPLVTVRGKGFSAGFSAAPWHKIREETYRGHGG